MRGLTETVREGHHRLRLNLAGRHLHQLGGHRGARQVLQAPDRHQGRAGDQQHVAAGPHGARHDAAVEHADRRDAGRRRPRRSIGRVLVRDGLCCRCSTWTPRARLVCRTSRAMRRGSIRMVVRRRPRRSRARDSRFALGIGAFGASDADCRDRFGEFIAVAGAAAYLPGDGTDVPDYLVASDARSARTAGAPRHCVRRVVRASSPLRRATARRVPCRSERAGGGRLRYDGRRCRRLVMVVRRPRASSAHRCGSRRRRCGAGDFFAFPDVRARLTFTAERAFASHRSRSSPASCSARAARCRRIMCGRSTRGRAGSGTSTRPRFRSIRSRRDGSS